MSASLRLSVIRLAHANPALRAHLLQVLKQARRPPPGVYDTGVTPKDKMRIRDMANKSRDDAHMLQLARTMAFAIKDADKAYRRGAAAEGLNYHAVADIFFDRAEMLAGGQPGAGPTSKPKPGPTSDPAAKARAEAAAKARQKADQEAAADRARADAAAKARAKAEEDARARARAKAETDRAKAEAQSTRNRDYDPDGNFSREKTLSRMRSIQLLYDGAKTPGEAAAAASALARLKLKLNTMRLASTNPVLRPYLLPYLAEATDD